MKKLTTIALTIFLLASFTLFSQNKPSNSVTENVEVSKTPKADHLKGLTKASPEDIAKQQIMLDGEKIPVYTTEGKRIRGMEMMNVLLTGDFSPEFYVDQDKEIKVAIFRPSTAEEKAKIKVVTDQMNTKSDHIGTDALPFSATDINGNEYSLDNLKGKIIVMNFWFVECKPCIMEMPELNEIVEEYKNNKDVVFLGFATNDKEKINSFLKKKSFSYTIIPNSKSIAEMYNVYSYPTHIIIGKDSKIKYLTSGLSPITISSIENSLRDLVKE